MYKKSELDEKSISPAEGSPPETEDETSEENFENVEEEYTEETNPPDTVKSDEIEEKNEGESKEEPPNQEEEPKNTEKPNTNIREKYGAAMKVLEKFGLPDMLIPRCITAYFLASAVNIMSMRAKGIAAVAGWKDFVQTISYPTTYITVFIVIALLSMIYIRIPEKYKSYDPLAAIASMILYVPAAMWKLNDSALNVSTTIIITAFSVYCLGKLKKENEIKIPDKITGSLVFVTAAAVCSFAALISVCHHKIFGTSVHDMGLFIQMYHSLSTNLTAVTSCERDMILSHFKVHASYIFYLLVPFYKIAPRGETLLICQAVLAMGGIVPMYLIAKNHKFKGLPLFFATMMYVFCAGIVAPCYFDFHENAFLPTLLMWLLWAVDRDKKIPCMIFSALVCIVKEDAPLYVVCIMLFAFFEKKDKPKRWIYLAVMAVAGVYMAFITSWLTKNGDGTMMTDLRFGNLLINETDSLGSVVKNVIGNPTYFFSQLVQEQKLLFMAQVFIPLMFLPFMTKKIRRFWLMMPFIIMNLAVGYEFAASVRFQYIFGTVCLIIYMSILNLDDMEWDRKKTMAVAAGIASFIMTFGLITPEYSYYETYRDRGDHFDGVDEYLQTIPLDASVGTEAMVLPHIANREEVYIFDLNDINLDTNELLTPEKFDFIIVAAQNDNTEIISSALEKANYKIYGDVVEGMIAYVSPSYIETHNLTDRKSVV